MSGNKKEKVCSDQFYFQNAVFTEKEPDEDQDDKDYVDIWLKCSNCTNKYIYVSIIGCDLCGSQFACQRNFTFCFFQRRRPLILTSSLWSAVQSVAKAGSRHKRELVTSPVISTSTDTNLLVQSCPPSCPPPHSPCCSPPCPPSSSHPTPKPETSPPNQTILVNMKRIEKGNLLTGHSQN